MRKIDTLLLSLPVLCVPLRIHAQWCVPTTAIPYDADMPGITHFTLNTIDRVSGDLEHYPNNNYTNTGLSTTLVKGQSYAVTIQFTIDPLICPDMNLRVWVDLNQDGQLDDPGETLLTANHRTPDSYTGTITIPLTAMSGSTRLRATAKMSNLGGHTLPTPCDDPPDALGYHGEFEDYTVEIVEATGIEEAMPPISAMSIRMEGDGDRWLDYTLNKAGGVQLDVFDAAGHVMMRMARGSEQQGMHSLLLSGDGWTPGTGLYLVRLASDGVVRSVRMLGMQ